MCFFVKIIDIQRFRLFFCGLLDEKVIFFVVYYGFCCDIYLVFLRFFNFFRVGTLRMLLVFFLDFGVESKKNRILISFGKKDSVLYEVVKAKIFVLVFTNPIEYEVLSIVFCRSLMVHQSLHHDLNCFLEMQ